MPLKILRVYSFYDTTIAITIAIVTTTITITSVTTIITITTTTNNNNSNTNIIIINSVAVFFNKELISLKKAISNVANKRDILIDAVKDHSLYFDNENEKIIIIPNIENANNYFIPFEDIDENDKDWSANRMGIYANDLAYHPNITEEEYNNTIREKNILQLVWRMEVKDDTLHPSWPVVIVNKDLKITNTFPMEVGVTYSFRYWKAAAMASKSSSSSSSSSPSSFASSTNQ